MAEKLLEAACVDYTFYIKHEWDGSHVSNLKSFTKTIFHWAKVGSFPYLRIKGGDIMLMLRWICRLLQEGCLDETTNKRPKQSLLDHPLDPTHAPLLRAVLKGCLGGLQFFHLLHRNGVWLDQALAGAAASASYDFCASYRDLARMAHHLRLRRFNMEPSLHYFHHYPIDIWERLEQGDEWVLSPNCDNCECDESFVGRVAVLSRHVHARTTTLRTLQRYKIKAYFVLTGQDWSSTSAQSKPKKKLRQH